MRSRATVHTEEFYGYVYFDDPNWWEGFAVSRDCAAAIEEFRGAIAALAKSDPNQHSRYTEAVSRVQEASERIVNHMQWHTKRNIALMIALTELYETAAGLIVPIDFPTGFMQKYLQEKALSIRALLTSMHDVHCGDNERAIMERET